MVEQDLRYRTIGDSGENNDEERFNVEVLVGKEVWGTGVGRSKRIAQGCAAAAALEKGAESNG